MRLRKAKSNILWYLVLAALLLFALFPIYWMLVTSLKGFREVYSLVPTLWPKNIAWGNYAEIFSRYHYGRALVNSIVVATSVSVVSIIIAVFAAYAIVRLHFRGRKIVPQVFLTSYLIPRTILFIPIYIFLARLGLTNTVLGLLLIYPTITIPYATWVLIAYFQRLPRELEEAALVDGATRIQTITHVVLPLAMPAIISTFIFSFTICWFEYIYALVIINAETQRTIPLALSSMLVADIVPWGPLMAGAVIASLPIMFIYLVGAKYIVSGLTLGSVKG